MTPLDVRGFGDTSFLLRRHLIRDFDAEAPVSPGFARLLKRVTPEPPPCACGDCQRKTKQEEGRYVRERVQWSEE